MTTVRPMVLPTTASKAGYDHIDPISQWFLGGSGTSGAEATGLDDDARYGLDLLNIGSGGKSLRATSGNGSYQIKVDNSGAVITGGLSVTGGSATFASLVVSGALAASGAATFQGGLSVTGGATFSGTGTATFGGNVVMNGLLNVTGGTVLHSSLVVTGPATFTTNVNIVQGLTVSQSTTLVGNLAVGGSLTVTQTALFVTDVTMQQGLVVSQSGTVQGNWTIAGSMAVTGTATFNGQAAFNDPVTFVDNPQIVGTDLTLNTSYINFDIGNGAGFTRSTWGGSVSIKHDGTVVNLPYF